MQIRKLPSYVKNVLSMFFKGFAREIRFDFRVGEIATSCRRIAIDATLRYVPWLKASRNI